MGIIVGVDEVGLGPIAGPVVVAAVAFDSKTKVVDLTDSKKLTDTRRRQLAPKVMDRALHWTIVRSSARQIDKHGIAQCKRACMKWAVRFCVRNLDAYEVIVDGVDPIPEVDCTCLVKADLKVQAVSGASVIAKVHRDDLMVEASTRYPKYQFDRHKGYLTSRHPCRSGTVRAMCPASPQLRAGEEHADVDQTPFNDRYKRITGGPTMSPRFKQAAKGCYSEEQLLFLQRIYDTEGSESSMFLAVAVAHLTKCKRCRDLAFQKMSGGSVAPLP